jgi:hypothetical protein
MRAISFKALLLSNLAYFLVLVLTLFAATTVVVVAVFLTADTRSLHGAIAELRASPPIFVFIAIVPCAIAALVAGYMAARVAQHDPLLNGALATSVAVMVDIFELVHGPVYPDTSPAIAALIPGFDLAFLVLAPLVAMLGGYLAGCRQTSDVPSAALRQRMRGFGMGVGSGV